MFFADARSNVQRVFGLNQSCFAKLSKRTQSQHAQKFKLIIYVSTSIHVRTQSYIIIETMYPQNQFNHRRVLSVPTLTEVKP